MVWDTAKFRGDWGVTSGDLQTDPGGLRSAVLLSLFTNKRAPSDWTPTAGSPSGRQGVWSDTYDGFQLGSWLWLLNREFISDSNAVLSRAKDYCLDSLSWLQTSGVVASITVTVGWIASGVMGIVVALTQPQSPPQTFNLSWAWQGA